MTRSEAMLKWHREHPGIMKGDKKYGSPKETHPLWGKGHSAESRKRISENHADCSGEKNSRWLGGRQRTSDGYTDIYVGIRPGRKRTMAREHRVVAEKALGRPLKPNEVVHHINCDKRDNRNCNLLVCTQSYHVDLHRKMAAAFAREKFGGNRGDEDARQQVYSVITK